MRHASEAAVLSAVETAMTRIRRRQGRQSLARSALSALGPEVSLNTLAVVDAVAESAGSADAPVTVGTVSDRLAVDPSRGSRVVAEAVRSGFLRRVASQEDGRRSCLELTDRGHQAVTSAHRTRQEFYARVFDGWPAREQEELARLLTKFVDSLDATTAG